MAETDPEDLGRALAQTVDRDALLAEAGSESTADLLPEILKSFAVQFGENQPATVRGQEMRVQHELLDTAFMDDVNSRYTSPENITVDHVLTLARDYARDALHEYANTLVSESASITYDDLPEDDDSQPAEDDIYAFTDAVVDGFWESSAQPRIEEYADLEASP